MRPFGGKRVLIGVSAGIAAYKTAELVRLLVQSGAEVDVVLTENAPRFVGATTFEGLTGRPVHQSIWDPPMAHLELGRQADAIAVAPATADFIARLACGRAEDLLTTLLLAAPIRALLAPAMNQRMYEHPATQRNIETLRSFGHEIVGPTHGELAEREVGWGRMAEPGVLLAHIGRQLEGETAWSGRRVVVTAGPTQEPLDEVRFLGNRSSGRMGYAVASALWRRGARVTLICGPGELPPPPEIDEVRRVGTAAELRGELETAVDGASALFMVAAVADFRPSSPSRGKIRRSESPGKIELEPVPDLLANIEADGCLKVAFAVEIGDEGRESARRKLKDKGAGMVVVNDPSEDGAGFEVYTNKVIVIDQHGEEELPLAPKQQVADEVVDRAERLLVR